MNESPRRDDSSSGTGPSTKRVGAKSKVGGIALVVLLAAYSFAAPRLNTRFGWDLPRLNTTASHNSSWADATRKEADSAQSAGNDRVTEVHTVDRKPVVEESAEQEETSESKAAQSGERTPGPLADRMRASRPNSQVSARGPPTETRGDSTSSADESELLYGLLREISRDRYISPAGLLFTPGSAEGHRLEHLRRHTKDDPGRPGSHGVFDGEMAGALKTIDRAYERAKKGQRTTKKVDDERTIYTVDLGQRVGYVGGRDGGRRRKPMARRVRLVVEGNRFITAYPL